MGAVRTAGAARQRRCSPARALASGIPTHGAGWRPRLGLRWRGVEPKRAENAPLWQWANDVSMLCLAGAIALIVFRVAQPYAFEGPSFWDMAFNQRWWDDIQREREFQPGNADYPPFVQFAGTSSFLTPL